MKPATTPSWLAETSNKMALAASCVVLDARSARLDSCCASIASN
ncbi:hypothetical protein JMJ77_0014461 [Colletotrichum scovillei]|uniref:Uncharacterized protein n=1 Tax=Colletotrichum scovillei TaxID=1209932 RepID=A0A9P7R3I1_9PEZI|nr:hypothetical protein JMJ77_0014461 [Colletotrichum scovillei]KAG7065997.1 hypothetical protein JMJ78_0012739 [Colletotrichum scovillei]KAG7068595.1 hypothetical protein JMJ76_0008278 [Colletotrichum scovillei]